MTFGPRYVYVIWPGECINMLATEFANASVEMYLHRESMENHKYRKLQVAVKWSADRIGLDRLGLPLDGGLAVVLAKTASRAIN